MKKLHVVKSVKKSDAPESDVRAGRQLEEAAFTALQKARKLFLNAAKAGDKNAKIHADNVRRALLPLIDDDL